MEDYSRDIVEQIKNNFNENSDEIFRKLESSSIEYNHMKSERIIRCVIFLSGDLLEMFDHYLYIAEIDWRDIVLYAEFIDDGAKKVRDFNLPFKENDLKIKN